MAWTKERPAAEGWYWVWQPPEQGPCRGQVWAVLVERGHNSLKPNALSGWVPAMDYADPVDSDTWDDALWMRNENVPEAPRA
jgi:hypothetical protein